ncbi:NAD(P)-dependent dehydrogenase (short-subunit alcohol dehydrogenase family) [Winogradskyella epiphytica]|uniref:NAD(P)-dependent dehydrogenase (Short-subunit alcohol dehydrogenase family) n=1 Tax=Winogradskyella epiphytica TaxID=262005 RepID=A0A2V4X9L2_9FLAO|nr:SDR family oxidoreductase [Winogradskyella epiphytica]PYE82745.1 NAD(P)-dependent dehydrogenase (short-subunit alcohol dehydrogenase family) [Winogradskyella epiphytica]GGW53317.1 oxidoreductase [Winogradskyella epiphytica]
MKNQKELIVITGGAGGIGQASARAFKGQPLILTDYSQEQVGKAVETLRKEGFDVSGIACDITDKDDIKKLVQYVTDKGALKALVHTAGVSGTVKDLKKVFTIDLIATEYLVEAFYHIAEKGSVAILLSSMMAHAVPAHNDYDEALRNPQNSEAFEVVSKFVNNDSDTMYNFAKRGVQLLTHKHANDWGSKGARIVSVSPGVIETPMALKAAEEHPERMEMIKQATPLKRNGQPEDVANVIYFLASDAANFITSTDILVDGGVIHNIKAMS